MLFLVSESDFRCSGGLVLGVAKNTRSHVMNELGSQFSSIPSHIIDGSDTDVNSTSEDTRDSGRKCKCQYDYVRLHEHDY